MMTVDEVTHLVETNSMFDRLKSAIDQGNADCFCKCIYGGEVFAVGYRDESSLLQHMRYILFKRAG